MRSPNPLLLHVGGQHEGSLTPTHHPQLVFFGHTNNITLDTLEEFKKINKNVIISQWNEDPMMTSLKDSKSNIEKIQYYNNYVDYNFITTDPSVLKKQKRKLKNTRFLFIPVDKNIECYNVYNLSGGIDAWSKYIDPLTPIY